MPFTKRIFKTCRLWSQKPYWFLNRRLFVNCVYCMIIMSLHCPVINYLQYSIHLIEPQHLNKSVELWDRACAVWSITSHVQLAAGKVGSALSRGKACLIWHLQTSPFDIFCPWVQYIHLIFVSTYNKILIVPYKI